MFSLNLKPHAIVDASMGEELLESSQFLKQTCFVDVFFLEFDALVQARQYLLEMPTNNTFFVR